MVVRMQHSSFDAPMILAPASSTLSSSSGILRQFAAKHRNGGHVTQSSKPKRSKKYLVWMDCEMTGLDPAKDVLLEIATIITNYDLEIIARGPVLAIRHPKSKLDMMDAWCRRTHGGSGPLDRVPEEGVPTAEPD